MICNANILQVLHVQHDEDYSYISCDIPCLLRHLPKMMLILDLLMHVAKETLLVANARSAFGCDLNMDASYYHFSIIVLNIEENCVGFSFCPISSTFCIFIFGDF
jgi:hypothetical protein